MSYQAFYRTYRPQKFSEVVGQKAVIKTLRNALSENKIAHAYLFCGPRGTGKTTMARLFAKALNCEEGIGHECDVCQNCVAVKTGSHPDVFEIDAASNSGVDSVRDLIDQVRYQPILGRYKVYIIDEVHNMSSSAFNALLKTLEEPPANVVFILATTEPQKVLPTILSRVQRFDFTKVSDEDIISKMSEILEKENVTYEEGSLELIARLADGGVRDALSILDQVVSYSGDNISIEDINTLFGLLNVKDKLDFVRKIGSKDLASVINTAKDMYSRGIDIVKLHDDLIKIFKDLLVFGMTKDESLLTVLKPNEALQTLIKPKDIKRSLNILIDARREYRKVTNAFDHFELTLIKLCSEEETPVISSVVNQSQNKPLVNGITSQVENTAKPETKIVEVKDDYVESVVKKKTVTNKVAEVSTIGPMLDISDDDVIQIMIQGSKPLKQSLMESWPKLKSPEALAEYGQYAVMLNACTPRIIGANVLVVETMFDAQAAKINLIANQEGLKNILSELFGVSPTCYAITPTEYIRLVQHYKNLQQARKLPDATKLDFDKILRKGSGQKFIDELKKED
ncbi:MAG TPA: DNA polymerase III subunit gamma/tau [Firmicutes bacterium]|mgnify:FL=1|nr:DNA polymerase III subunit gamma/tau [Bacillota bacterium]HAW99802.1 DNA polymerase III subunit gamma/tau [Bacillota bacterium]